LLLDLGCVGKETEKRIKKNSKKRRIGIEEERIDGEEHLREYR
jgi:hypothetical protein